MECHENVSICLNRPRLIKTNSENKILQNKKKLNAFEEKINLILLCCYVVPFSNQEINGVIKISQ